MNCKPIEKFDGICPDCDESVATVHHAALEKLEAENNRLRNGINGDYDLDAWLDWAQEKESLNAQLAEAREAIQAAHDALCDAPEINPSNYDHDQVCSLNREANYAFSVLHGALAGQGGK